MNVSLIDSYLAHRTLMWAGHVAHMGNERLPRRMIFARVQKTRNGNQSYARQASQTVQPTRICQGMVKLAQDPDSRVWRARIQPDKYNVQF